MTDSEAVIRCQNGDRDAFRHLVEQYKDLLYGTAVLMTGNRDTAEDQVQEALLSAWRGIRGFHRGRPVKPWFLRILINTVLSWRRKKSIPIVYLSDQEPQEPIPPRETPQRPSTLWKGGFPLEEPSPNSAWNTAR